MRGMVMTERLDRRQGCILIPSLYPVVLHRRLSTIHLHHQPPLQARSPLTPQPRIGPVLIKLNLQFHRALHRLSELHLQWVQEDVRWVEPAALGEDAGRSGGDEVVR